MTNDPYNRGLDIFRDSEADDDFNTDSEVLSAHPMEGSTTTAQYVAQGTGPAYAGTLGAVNGGGTGNAAAKAGDVAGSAATKAGDIAGSAAEKAVELKDVALDRGGDVATVAKDELARLANDARTEVQSLWANASEQLRGQAATGQKQLSELLHSLAGELGEMASKSDNTGPLTALAKQAAAKGGELSHWLEASEPGDVMIGIRRFARQRPFVFLASAALAGVVVGRLGRGLMAAGDADTVHPARAAVTDSGSVQATTGITSAPAVTYEEVPSFGMGDTPEQVESYGSQATSSDPYGLGAGSAR